MTQIDTLHALVECFPDRRFHAGFTESGEFFFHSRDGGPELTVADIESAWAARPRPPRQWTRTEFREALGPERRAAIRALTQSDPEVADVYEEVLVNETIVANNPRTIAGFVLLVDRGIFTAAEADEFLDSGTTIQQLVAAETATDPTPGGLWTWFKSLFS